ncbi:hypothetical protein BH11ARM2_BH11ARM2_16680 [soil metagenome]
MNPVSPLVSSVVDRLTDWVRNGGLPTGLPLPSERQLADDLGVSRPIVRAAIRVLETREFLVCKPRCRPVVRMPEAKPLKQIWTGGNRYVALWLWPNSVEYGAATILSGIQRVSLPESLHLTVSGAPASDDWNVVLQAEERFLRSIAENGQATAAIVWYLGGEHNLPALRAVHKAGVPLIFVDRLPPEGFEADFVGTNNERAAGEIIRHLVSLRHRRIAIITNLDKVSSVLERERGYRRALTEAGLESDLFREVGHDDESDVAAAIEALLALNEPPTAICGINDGIALHIHDVLTSRGMDIPGEISVVGFDGLLGWLPGGGYLTTVHQDFLGIGQTAAELALRRIAAGTPAAFRHVLIDAPLREHGSTGRAREATSSSPCNLRKSRP